MVSDAEAAATMATSAQIFFVAWRIDRILQYIQVNLFQKHLFLHKLIHNYDKRLFVVHENCKVRTWGEHVVYISCSECQNKKQNNLCTQHVLPMF